MNRLFYPVLFSMILLVGCDSETCIIDSDVSAINRQTEVLKKQNRILERIATALEEQVAERKGENDGR